MADQRTTPPGPFPIVHRSISFPPSHLSSFALGGPGDEKPWERGCAPLPSSLALYIGRKVLLNLVGVLPWANCNFFCLCFAMEPFTEGSFVLWLLEFFTLMSCSVLEVYQRG